MSQHQTTRTVHYTASTSHDRIPGPHCFKQRQIKSQTEISDSYITLAKSIAKIDYMSHQGEANISTIPILDSFPQNGNFSLVALILRVDKDGNYP